MTPADLISLGCILNGDWSVVEPDRAYQLLKGLQAALPRLIEEANARRPPPEPTWTCANCGATGMFRPVATHFQPHVFTRQAEEFRRKHSGCLPIQDGGCI